MSQHQPSQLPFCGALQPQIRKACENIIHCVNLNSRVASATPGGMTVDQCVASVSKYCSDADNAEHFTKFTLCWSAYDTPSKGECNMAQFICPAHPSRTGI